MSAEKKNRPLGLLDSDNRVIPQSYIDESFRGDYTGTNLIYRGVGRPGISEDDLAWKICQFTYDGSNNVISILWPINSTGAVSKDYEFSWTDRASYTFQ